MPIEIRYKRPVICSFDVFFVVSLNKLLNKPSSYRKCDVTESIAKRVQEIIWYLSINSRYLDSRVSHTSMAWVCLLMRLYCKMLKTMRAKQKAWFVINKMYVIAQCPTGRYMFKQDDLMRKSNEYSSAVLRTMLSVTIDKTMNSYWLIDLHLTTRSRWWNRRWYGRRAPLSTSSRCPCRKYRKLVSWWRPYSPESVTPI